MPTDRSLETTPLTICPCINVSTYDCKQRYLGTVSPGQMLTIKLKLARFHSSAAPFITTFTEIDQNMPHACHLLNVLEIQQKLQGVGISLFCFYFYLFFSFWQFFFLFYYAQDFAQSFNVLLKVKLYS